LKKSQHEGEATGRSLTGTWARRWKKTGKNNGVGKPRHQYNTTWAMADREESVLRNSNQGEEQRQNAKRDNGE